MIPVQFEFKSPNSVAEALEVYNEFQGETIYLSGGTDLVPRMKLGLLKPKAIIDLKHIASLKTIEEQGDWIRIGSLMPLFELKQKAAILDLFPALAASLEATSCESLQMRGTIGGNLLQNTRCLFYNQSEFWRGSKGFCLKMGGEKCNAVPGAKRCFANYCSDNAPSLCTLSAEVSLAGPDGTRRLNLEELYTNKPGKPFALKPGEILTDIFVPNQKTTGGYEKLRVRGAIDFPLLGVAFSFADPIGRLAVGAVGAKPYRAEINRQGEMESALETILKQVTTVANTVLDPDYRKQMVTVFSERLVRKVMEGVK